MDKEIRKVQITRNSRAMFVPSTVDEANRTIEITWSTGATVYRDDWWDGQYFEELSLDPAHVRLDRLNQGAPLLDTHNSYSLKDQIGVVERAWVENGVGKAIVRFSSRPEVEGVWNDVRTGIIRNISVGYSVFSWVNTRIENDIPTFWLRIGSLTN